jgi:hypothetical protein
LHGEFAAAVAIVFDGASSIPDEALFEASEIAPARLQQRIPLAAIPWSADTIFVLAADLYAQTNKCPGKSFLR